MSNFKTFDEFIYLSETNIAEGYLINEGLLDKLISFFTKIANIFKDPDKINKATSDALENAGKLSEKFLPTQTKVNGTAILKMGDGKNAKSDFTMALTKLADLPDKSVLFQISGTSSKDMLKMLVNSENVEDLGINSVMVIISPNGFEKGKPAVMKILKNMMPQGKSYVSKTALIGATTTEEVEKQMNKS